MQGVEEDQTAEQIPTAEKADRLLTRLTRANGLVRQVARRVQAKFDAWWHQTYEVKITYGRRLDRTPADADRTLYAG